MPNHHNAKSCFDDDTRALIAKLWQCDELSGSEIADVIGRTRNAVLGFAWRNRNLCPRRGPMGSGGPRAKRRGRAARPAPNPGRKPSAGRPRLSTFDRELPVKPVRAARRAELSKAELRAMFVTAWANTAVQP